MIKILILHKNLKDIQFSYYTFLIKLLKTSTLECVDISYIYYSLQAWILLQTFINCN